MSAGFRTFNPRKNSWNPEVYFPTSEDDCAFLLDSLSSGQSFYGKESPAKRAEFLRVIAVKMNSNKEGIKNLYLSESGLSESRFESEWNRTIQTIELFANYLSTDYLAEKVQHFPSESLHISKRKYPIGPVLVLGSSNFPLAYSTGGGDTISALSAGCCVVVKAHPMHVGTSTAVANCILEAVKQVAYPDGIFTHLIDDGHQLAQNLCLDERIQAVGFTGSFKGGKAFMDLVLTRKNPIPVFAEMGSANPVIIHDDLSKFEQVDYATKLAFSITNDAGQFCTKPGIIFVPNGEAGEGFLDELKHAISSVKPVPMLHPRIHQNYESRRNQIRSIKGVKTYFCETETKGIEGKWCLAETTMKDFNAHKTMQEEVFGPFALVVKYERVHELNECLRLFSGQLTGSIFYHNQDSKVEEWIELLSAKVGRIVLNGVPTGVRVLETMHHGGPYPASSDVRFTAVGQDSIQRFQKDVTIQVQNIT